MQAGILILRSGINSKNTSDTLCPGSQYDQMLKQGFIVTVLLFSFGYLNGQDTLRFSGQASGWVDVNKSENLPLWGGARYIPQLNPGTGLKSGRRIDAEFSLNLYGSAATDPFDTISASADIKAYRTWVRFSSDQFEIRLGLQRISFGSASILRPLMWFDQIDPRDPLKMTDGVWSLLGRYYFLNNANIWVWGLYGNNKTKGWEVIPVNKNIPEFGGRLQIPVPGGEAAISYHHRIADSRNTGLPVPEYEKIGENRIGMDAKWDFVTGVWIEGSYATKNKDMGMLNNELAINAGIDYTFRLGSGLYTAFEQLLASNDEEPFAFTNPRNFSLISASYPVGIFDKVSTFIYYDWKDNNIYSFINWQKQFDRIMLYIMAYWNPETFLLPAQAGTQNPFAGKGIQIMFVLNH